MQLYLPCLHGGLKTFDSCVLKIMLFYTTWELFSDDYDESGIRRTVNGQVCTTKRSFDDNVKYYYCHTGQGDDEWDYCCRPGTKCGYSKQSKFPW